MIPVGLRYHVYPVASCCSMFVALDEIWSYIRMTYLSEANMLLHSWSTIEGAKNKEEKSLRVPLMKAR